nr:hypothetical protein [Candidatus Gracilibacteria bacterium]
MEIILPNSSSEILLLSKEEVNNTLKVIKGEFSGLVSQSLKSLGSNDNRFKLGIILPSSEIITDIS